MTNRNQDGAEKGVSFLKEKYPDINIIDIIATDQAPKAPYLKNHMIGNEISWAHFIDDNKDNREEVFTAFIGSTYFYGRYVSIWDIGMGIKDELQFIDFSAHDLW